MLKINKKKNVFRVSHLHIAKKKKNVEKMVKEFFEFRTLKMLRKCLN